jgi:predicted nucleic acid-binding protein
MIYLDTSAFIKLYLHEPGSVEVHRLVVAQDDPLPVTHLMELEFLNALRFKAFLKEMAAAEVGRVISLYRERKRGGQYFVPLLDPITLHEMSLRMTERTPALGCRALDILHVASAVLCEAKLFVTADRRQAGLAKAEARDIAVV